MDKFPNSIEDVITENNGTTYQFSPVVPGGRWWTVDTDQGCWDALKLMKERKPQRKTGKRNCK